MEVINTSGRRKSAIARVYMTEGKGNIVVNKKDYKDYFPTWPNSDCYMDGLLVEVALYFMIKDLLLVL